MPKATSEHRRGGGTRGAVRAPQGSVSRTSGMAPGQLHREDSKLHRATGARRDARRGEDAEVETHGEGPCG